MNPGIDRGDIVCPARFKQHTKTRICQHRHERFDIFLQQRLTARKFDERDSMLEDLGYDLAERAFLPLVKRILRVAIRTTQIAECQPDEYAGQPRPGALALNRRINLVDRQRWFASRHDGRVCPFAGRRVE